MRSGKDFSQALYASSQSGEGQQARMTCPGVTVSSNTLRPGPPDRMGCPARGLTAKMVAFPGWGEIPRSFPWDSRLLRGDNR